MKKIKEMFELLDVESDNGFFFRLFDEYGVQFIKDENEANSLDYDYYLSYSAEKTITPMFEYRFNQDPATCVSYMLNVIVARFLENWKKRYKALYEDVYNAIDNMKITEQANYNDNHTIQQTEQTDLRTTQEVDNGAYGYNSVNPVGVTNQNSTSTVVGSPDSNKKNTTGNKSSTNSVTRSGNNGSRTYQELIEQELELRKVDFFASIYKDMDTILCMKVYDL